ncbi:hypothetical protein FRC12_000853 [Ceratobasidium sp. 428]|nr:hypothetical protein FRC12_000853 [Ceratobasidium sp. 428]
MGFHNERSGFKTLTSNSELDTNNGNNNEPTSTTTPASTTVEPSSAEFGQPESDTLRKSLGGLKGALEENVAFVIRRDHSGLVAERYRVIPLDLELAQSNRDSTIVADGSNLDPPSEFNWTISHIQSSTSHPPRAKGCKAVSIGIDSKNANPKERVLEHAASDAKQFRRCLTGQLGFREQDVRMITDDVDPANAVKLRENIQEQIKWLFEGAGCDDTLVLFRHCIDRKKAALLVSLDGHRPPHVLISSPIILDCCCSAGLIRLPEVQKMEFNETSTTRSAGFGNNTSVATELVSTTSQSQVSAPARPLGGIWYTITQLLCPIWNWGPKETEHSQTGPARSEHIAYPVATVSDEPTGQAISPRLPTPCPSSSMNEAEYEVYKTKANVTIWVATGPDQLAYELPGEEGGGILSHTVRRVIAKHGPRVDRQKIWDEICRITRLVNEQHNLEQQPRILSSAPDSAEAIMGAQAFVVREH